MSAFKRFKSLICIFINIEISSLKVRFTEHNKMSEPNQANITLVNNKRIAKIQ